MYKKLDDGRINSILETGIDEFAANGLDRSNINLIAKNAGVSVGVIYKYFGDKDGFFLACVRHSLDLLDGYRLRHKKHCLRSYPPLRGTR